MPAVDRGKVIVPIAVLLLLVAAWRVLSLGMADQFARSDPGTALDWRSSHPLALLSAAEQLALKGGDPARAAALARAALSANPLEGRAFRVLAQLAEAAGNQAEAIRFYERASALSPRDIPTHMWLEGYYLSSGKPVEALRHIDLLLRIEPEKNWRQYHLLQAMAGFPPAHAALAAALIRQPPWRERFFAQICADAPGSSVAVTPLMNALRQAPGGLTGDELSHWLDCMSRDRRWGEAYLTWVASLPSDRQTGLANVFNGGFEYEPSGIGFDWRVKTAPGFLIERLPTQGAEGETALRISFQEGRIQFNHLRQLLVLSPGAYRWQGRSRAEGLRSEPGLVWTVQCAEDNKQLAATSPVTGLTPWRDIQMNFEVPTQGCGAQWLQLAVPARTKAEQRIGGRAWFDDIRVVRSR